MQYFKKAMIAIVVTGTLFGPMKIDAAGAQDNSTNREMSRAVEDLKSSDTEWRREDAKYRQQRAAGVLSADGASEYAEFVASLHRQKLENCEAVRRLGGDVALTDLNCVHEGSIGSAVTVPILPPGGAKTNSENIEHLDSELKRLEAELDESLRQKQLENRSREQASQAGGGNLAGGQAQGGGTDGSPAGGGAATDPANQNSPQSSELSNAGKGEDSSKGTTSGQNSGNAGKNRAGSASAYPPATSAPGAVPANRPENNPTSADGPVDDEGKDDDIVMRQIREAAEQETDPVMKEKLWDEYRRLKFAKR